MEKAAKQELLGGDPRAPPGRAKGRQCEEGGLPHRVSDVGYILKERHCQGGRNVQR